jgi:predicted RNase H-like HicB family nuclease
MSDKTATTTPPAVEPVTIEIEVKVRLKAVALQEEDGRYSIVVPALPGCYSAADSIDEASANVVEAAEGWLDVGHDREKAAAVRKMLP